MQNIIALIINWLKRGLGVPLALVVLLMLMILPIPPILLDFFFTFSITLSLLVLLSGIYILRPLDFAVFPTILLLATLLRLALNVASTRVVLLHGHSGAHAAGNVIQAFGAVVIGGNYAVGLVVFAILIIINFVVITKGAGRVSEVSARFTLDALPGKQMSIDADLNAGIIEQDEAKKRRSELAKEADFYGSMDGASKFVRGDAIAGILILLINLIGGICIGVFQHALSFAQAVEIYALLTIGDGLVAQLPGLILSTAAAMMVTRVSSEEDIGQQVFFQVFNNPKPLIVTGGILIFLGLIPGMPHIAFVGLGVVIALFGYKLIRAANKPVAVTQQEEQKNDAAAKEEQEITWDDVPLIDTIGLEIGYRLISLVEKAQSGELMARIKGIRRKLSQELGFLVPSVHIKDNLDLLPNTYRISILGVTVGENKVYIDKDLAINPGQIFGSLAGIETKEPAFGLQAFWIDKTERQHAQTLGYTVVDPSTVIATHLSQIIQNQAYQLVGYKEVQKLLDILATDVPKLVEGLIPKIMSLGTVVKVIQNLLRENIPIRDMKTIIGTLSEVGTKVQDPIILTEAVRVALGSMIVQQINGFNKELSVMTLEPKLEQILQKSIQTTEENGIMVEPGLAEKLQSSIKECAERQEIAGLPQIILVSGAIRQMLAKFIRSFAPNISVLSYQEIPEDKNLKIVGSIG